MTTNETWAVTSSDLSVITESLEAIAVSIARACPAIESRDYLCARTAQYQINGTLWCRFHARRVQEQDS